MKIIIEGALSNKSAFATAFGVPESCIEKEGDVVSVSLEELSLEKAPCYYKLKSGESLASVCRKFSLPQKVLQDENEGVEITSGVTVFVPKFGGRIYVVKPLDTISSVAAKFSFSEKELIAKNDITYLYPGLVLLVD